MEENFQDRMYLGSQAVYSAIERGEYTNPGQVEAALMNAQANASEGESNA